MVCFFMKSRRAISAFAIRRRQEAMAGQTQTRETFRGAAVASLVHGFDRTVSGFDYFF